MCVCVGGVVTHSFNFAFYDNFTAFIATYYAEDDLPALLKRVFKDVVSQGRARDQPSADALLRRIDEEFKTDAEKTQAQGR